MSPSRKTNSATHAELELQVRRPWTPPGASGTASGGRTIPWRRKRTLRDFVVWLLFSRQSKRNKATQSRIIEKLGKNELQIIK